MNHRQESDGKPTVARALGQTLATVQHLADLFVAWGSRRLKQAGDQAEPVVPQKGVLPLVRRSLRVTARFVGNLGDAYYEWYERLKARKKE